MYLITEYCRGPFYMGWHIYLRDSMGRQQPNANGEWGWLCRNHWQLIHAHAVLETLGIKVTGDGSCDYDGYAEVARRFPIPRHRIGGKPRGCIPVSVGDAGEIIAADDKWRVAGLSSRITAGSIPDSSMTLGTVQDYRRFRANGVHRVATGSVSVTAGETGNARVV